MLFLNRACGYVKAKCLGYSEEQNVQSGKSKANLPISYEYY